MLKPRRPVCWVRQMEGERDLKDRLVLYTAETAGGVGILNRESVRDPGIGHRLGKCD